MYVEEQSTMSVKNLKFTFTVLDIRYITVNFPFRNVSGMTNESKLSHFRPISNRICLKPYKGWGKIIPVY